MSLVPGKRALFHPERLGSVQSVERVTEGALLSVPFVGVRTPMYPSEMLGKMCKKKASTISRVRSGPCLTPFELLLQLLVGITFSFLQSAIFPTIKPLCLYLDPGTEMIGERVLGRGLAAARQNRG
jgi:hypothetical protein